MKRWGLGIVALIIAAALGACNSTESVLDPAAGAHPSETVGTQTALAPESEGSVQAGPLTPPIPDQPTARAAAASPSARVQLAPIVGSTVEAVTPLSRRLSGRAAQRGIALAASGDATTTHIMKGYFSTISENGETTVIYVWDVLDAAGNRLHRIQGQEKAGKGDGWAVVPAATMEAIADRTLDHFYEWLASRQG
jgi:hypothetical protein